MSKGGRPKGEEWNHFTEAEMPIVSGNNQKQNGDQGGMADRSESESSYGDCTSAQRAVTVCNHCGTTVSNKAARLRAHLKQCSAYLSKYANSLENHSPLDLADKRRSLQVNLPDSSYEEPKCKLKRHSMSISDNCLPRDLRTSDKALFRQVDVALARFLYGCNLSFNTVENPLLIDLLQKLNPNYSVPSKRTLGNALIEDITGKISQDESSSVSPGSNQSSSSSNGLAYVTINPSSDRFDTDMTSVFTGATYISRTHGSHLYSPMLTSPIKINGSREHLLCQSPTPEQSSIQSKRQSN